MVGDEHAAGAPVRAGATTAPGDFYAACGRTGPGGRRDAARASVVWDVLRDVLADAAAATDRAALNVIDVGGGTGGFAVPLAALGHHVTVVDPSPDSLAAAQRRAAEINVPVSAVQGEAGGLDSVVGEGATDLVICHSVLEYVESPPDAMSAIARVLRPGGTVSVLASGAVAAVLHRALAGRFGEARALLAGTAGGPPRGFSLGGLCALLEGAGLRPGEAHGIRVFADLVPSALVDADPGAADALRALEAEAATHPALRDIAAQLHVLGHR